MKRKITTIGFDADDTLWHNETFFHLTQQRFAEMLADYADSDHLSERLIEAEIRNIKTYGYGVKGFTLSMIETAIEITNQTVPANLLLEILNMGKDMLDHPVDLLHGAKETVTSLSEEFELVLITKGDLLHQERKLAQSGLGDYFSGVEIVSEKSAETYRSAFLRHGTGPEEAMMVGNSMKSDVLPALSAGSWGTLVPQELEWELEKAPEPVGHSKFHEIENLSGLPPLLERVSNI